METNRIKEIYRVLGMTCAACAGSLESYLKPLAGVKHVSVNYPNQSVEIEFDQTKISETQLKKAAEEIGYEILIGSKENVESQFEAQEVIRYNRLKKKLIWAITFSFPIFMMSMFFMGRIPYENWVMLILSLPVLFWCGGEFYVIAWKKLKQKSANMDTLVALSTGMAFLFSVFNTIYPQYFSSQGVKPHVYYESAVIIITLILLGRFLEDKAKGKTSSAIKQLMGLKPKYVNVVRNGEEVSIEYKDVRKGDLILLKPGEKVPIDGKVKKGYTYIDESMITGEPIPVEKTKGSKVFSGTVNQNGSLKILATETGDNTLLSQIIKRVKEAQASKPAIQKLADKIAGIFVPVVIVLALLAFGIWYIYGPNPQVTYALLSLITVLIIACPCALGLATPTALMVGIGKGAELGILIKDAQVLETIYKTNALVLDKTGTITQGRPKVTDMLWANDKADSNFKEILLAIELQSEHPIAGAIVEHLKLEGIHTLALEGFKSITGKGVVLNTESINYCVGNMALMKVNNVQISEDWKRKADHLLDEAKTVVYFAKNEKVIGLIAVSDQVKSTAKRAIQEIQSQGVDVYMLTGDNAQTAKVIASKVGITHVNSEVLPTEKGDFIKDLQSKGLTVTMVGDGINDSEALAQADVGIAMGSGTDIAMENAGITLMQSDLLQIVKTIKLSNATIKTIRQNLFWAFIYNIIAIPIAAGVLYPINGFLLNPMLAGAAMSLSSISVLLNSLRLKKKNIT